VVMVGSSVGGVAGCDIVEVGVRRWAGDWSRATDVGTCARERSGRPFTDRLRPTGSLSLEVPMSNQRHLVSSRVVAVDPGVELTALQPWLGECWSVVGPAGGMCTDDLSDQFLEQRVGVVVGEGGSPFRVFAGLVLVAAHPLDRLGQVGDRVEWNPGHADLGHFGDERCLFGVAVGDGGGHLADQLGEDVVAVPLVI
jgi:hypothetical protein